MPLTEVRSRNCCSGEKASERFANRIDIAGKNNEILEKLYIEYSHWDTLKKTKHS